MNARKGLWAVASVCLGVLLAARASGPETRTTTQPTSAPALSDQIFTRITAPRVEQILKKMGIAFEEKTGESGNPYLAVKLADMKAQLFFYGKSENGYTSLQMHAGFESSAERATVLNNVNEWNRTKRFSRAYVGKDNYRHLESDLDLEGGVTEKAIGEFLTTFRVLMMRFATD